MSLVKTFSGTKNVISCCVREGVKGLLYTSSFVVVASDDVDIVMADESVPYPDESAVHTAYAATKQRAEKLVIAANGTSHASGITFRIFIRVFP